MCLLFKTFNTIFQSLPCLENNYSNFQQKYSASHLPSSRWSRYSCFTVTRPGMAPLGWPVAWGNPWWWWWWWCPWLWRGTAATVDPICPKLPGCPTLGTALVSGKREAASWKLLPMTTRWWWWCSASVGPLAALAPYPAAMPRWAMPEPGLWLCWEAMPAFSRPG